jgi:hypothetical protein
LISYFELLSGYDIVPGVRAAKKGVAEGSFLVTVCFSIQVGWWYNLPGK